jgi:murein L,D-transpeptidase YafK
MCDEFFLVNKRATQRKMTYIDTPLKLDIDSILVLKQKREMYVYCHNKLLKVYHVCLGFTPVGAKHLEGDGKTPEGRYYICDKNLQSEYHKSLGVSYPNEADKKYALAAHKPAGGNIKIHGLPNGEGQNKEAYIYEDWTWGCIALTDEEIDEVFAHTALKTSILILP